MKSFSVDNQIPHDLSITNGKIDVAEDKELLRQKIQAVWSTNKGEWSLNADEGIEFDVLLGKDPDETEIRAELEEALETISDTASIVGFEVIKDRKTRKMTIRAEINDGDTNTDVDLEV